jgi:peptidoglycan hydrolase-like protein with peptidoglycan-binding domain
MHDDGIMDQRGSIAIDGLPVRGFGSRYLRLMQPYQRSTDVKILQVKLKILDIFDPGPIDGIFGSLTDRAVRTFQQYYRLTVDGIVGPNTFWTLGESTGPYLGGAPRLGSRILHSGMQGGDVWILQNRLNIAGEIGTGVASGVFDAVTTSAVKEFQSAMT